jgi:thermitase
MKTTKVAKRIIILLLLVLGLFQFFGPSSVLAGDSREVEQTGSIAAPITNDSYVDKQWALQRIQGLVVEPTGTKEILVAVLDTGIDQQHEDLVGKVVGSVNFTDSPTASDVLGHGTHIAGIIAANTNNGIGVAGIAPNCRLLNVKIADDKGVVRASAVAKGIIWAVDNGAKIINMSLAMPATIPALDEAVNYAWSKGVVMIAAAGNDGKAAPTYPADEPHVIAVAATDAKDNLWSMSNRGAWVDIYAPGAGIYSTQPGDKYCYRSGTSMAAAVVSAVAALTLATVTDTNGDGQLNDEVTGVLTTVFARSK